MLSLRKTIGSAVVAVLVLTGVAIAPAHAEDEGQFVAAFETGEHESALVTATDATVENPILFTFPSETISCSPSEFQGELEGGTGQQLSLETAFGGPLAEQKCSAGGFPLTIENNGCRLELETAQTSEEGTWQMSTDLHCPEGKTGIIIRQFSGGSHDFETCTTIIPPQTGLEGISAENKANTPSAPHDLTMAVELVTHFTQTGLCGETEGNLEIHGELTMTAYNSGEEQIDLYVEHAEPPPPPNLHGESADHSFTFSTEDIGTCDGTFASSAEGTFDPDDELRLASEYSDCTLAGFPATIVDNGCEYVLHSLSRVKFNHHDALVDIQCPEGQPGIEFRAYAGGSHGFQVCTALLPPQSGGEAATLVNNEAKTDVTLSGAVEGLEFIRSGLCEADEGEVTYDVPGTTLTGEEPFHVVDEGVHGESDDHAFTIGDSTLECGAGTLDGVPEQFTIDGDDAIELAPGYGGGCTIGELPATVAGNGCDYVLRDLQVTGEDFEGVLDLACPEGVAGIQIRAYANEEHAATICTITIFAGEELGSVTVANNEATTGISLEGTIEAPYTQTGLCGHDEGTAAYHLPATALSGEEPFHVVDVEVHGASSEHVFTFSGYELECGTNTFSATLDATTIEGDDELRLEPSYGGGCIASELPATVAAKGCAYVVHDLVDEGEDFEAQLDLDCPEGVAGMEVEVFAAAEHAATVCTITIFAGEELGTVTVANNEATTDIALEGTIDAPYTQTGLCGHLEKSATYDLTPTTLESSLPIHAS